MMERLQGQRILVTGAARGLGAVFCHAIANAGGTVLALGRDEAALLAMLDGCKAAHDVPMRLLSPMSVTVMRCRRRWLDGSLRGW